MGYIISGDADGICFLRDIERDRGGRCVRWIISGMNPVNGKVFAIRYKTDDNGRGIYWQAADGEWYCNKRPDEIGFDYRTMKAVRRNLLKYWEKEGNPYGNK